MKREGMPAQRHEEKRVEEHASALEREREKERTHRGRGGERALATPFVCVFLPLGLPYVIWACQECGLFCLRSSLWSSDLPLFYFCGLFPSLSFSHPHSGLLFPILTT